MGFEQKTSTTVETKEGVSQQSKDFANETAARVENEMKTNPDASVELAREGAKVGDTLGTKAQTENIDIKPKEDKKSIADRIKATLKSIDSLFDRTSISKMKDPKKIIEMVNEDLREIKTKDRSNTMLGGVSFVGSVNWGEYGEAYNLREEAKFAEEEEKKLSDKINDPGEEGKKARIKRGELLTNFSEKINSAAAKRIREIETAQKAL